MNLADRLKQLLSSGNPSQEGNTQQQQQPPREGITQTQQLIQQNQENNKAAKSPEELYAEIWGTAPQQSPGSTPLFNTDQAKFGEAVSKMDFGKSVPKEMLEKAAGGDMQTLMEIINRVGQNAFSTATISSREMIEHANRTQGSSIEKLVQEQVRTALANQNLTKRNENFNDPTVAPLLKEISSRLRAKFPEASADDLAKNSEEMLMAIAQKIVSGSPAEKARQKQQQEVKKSETFDWDSWATTEPRNGNQQTDFDVASLFSSQSGGNPQ